MPFCNIHKSRAPPHHLQHLAPSRLSFPNPLPHRTTPSRRQSYNNLIITILLLHASAPIIIIIIIVSSRFQLAHHRKHSTQHYTQRRFSWFLSRAVRTFSRNSTHDNDPVCDVQARNRRAPIRHRLPLFSPPISRSRAASFIIIINNNADGGDECGGGDGGGVDAVRGGDARGAREDPRAEPAEISRREPLYLGHIAEQRRGRLVPW
mmetsp:Transcript_13595/g.29445  ORF Transcript_13595/g.29445 Transcript_13595/m.29445 type:complete len:207 (+) Transcript_13595:488-1108(+)